MGVVYEAEQISLGRRVALKVLPFAAALDARQLQRFKNEAQAAARLHHPNIVPVYAVGCERGVHFYAMQFIEGQTLAAVIDELRRPGGRRRQVARRHDADAAPTADPTAAGPGRPRADVGGPARPRPAPSGRRGVLPHGRPAGRPGGRGAGVRPPDWASSTATSSRPT